MTLTLFWYLGDFFFFPPPRTKRPKVTTVLICRRVRSALRYPPYEIGSQTYEAHELKLLFKVFSKKLLFKQSFCLGNEAHGPKEIG